MTGVQVVECWDGRVFLGIVERSGPWMTVLSGLQGRPPLLHEDDVAELLDADGHPDIENT